MRSVSLIRILPHREIECRVNPDMVVWWHEYDAGITTIFLISGEPLEVRATFREVTDKLTTA